VALLLGGLLLITAAFAVYFAVEAADAAADAEMLSDGVDRSALPRPEAVALAELARSRSASVPHDMMAHGDHGDSTHEHDEMTAEEHRTLAAQLRAAQEAVPGLDTTEEASAAGYVEGSSITDGTGAHWIKWSLVDRPFDPAAPSMILMDELERGKGPELIAFSYWVASPEEPEGFAGEADQWHRHLEVCFDNGYLVDQDVAPDECEGDWINGMDLWMLHAWVVPDVENQHGMFATVNPLLCESACGIED
jgi:hypothetical protein